jgi:hypothetical protein
MRNRYALVLTVGAALALGGCGGGGGSPRDGSAIALSHDSAAGTLFAVPGPRKCATRKIPAGGAPSPGEAARYVTCGAEGQSGEKMYVVDKVVVAAVAPGRAYDPHHDLDMVNPDPKKQVYAIRGSLERYDCGPILQPGGADTGPGVHAGTNCGYTIHRHASGNCYQDLFGDWSCAMIDPEAAVDSKLNVPPPAA